MATRNSWNNQVLAANVTFNGGTMNIGSDNTDNAINIGTAANAGRTTTIGNTSGASRLNLEYATGNFHLTGALGDVMVAIPSGEITYPHQPAFLAYLATSDLNQTGAGASYVLGSVTALTEVFDQNADFNVNGTFTASITGRYFLSTNWLISGCTVSTGASILIVTSNRSYTYINQRAAGSQSYGFTTSLICNMDAGDTATFSISAIGEAGNTDDIYGNATPGTWVSGYLVC